MNNPFALFAFGRYYPNGGFDDFRGSFKTEQACRDKFTELIPDLMREMGYGRAEGNGSLTGQIVKIETMELVATIKA